jgi:MFS family permease
MGVEIRSSELGAHGKPLECPAPVSLRREVRFAAPIALIVMGAMMPATVVIPVIRPLVASGWPGREWVFHAFMAVNLLGACLLGPALAVWADRIGNRRAMAGSLALLDGVLIALVALRPSLGVMLALRFVQGAASVGAVSILMGAVRGRSAGSAATGLVGSAVVLALVVGIPLGAILGKSDPSLPLLVGGALGALAGVASFGVLPDRASSPLSGRDVWRAQGVRLPVLVVGLERFSVGAFTVTLQLFAFHVLKVPDGTVSRWFTVFLVTFAIATVPLTRIGDRFNRHTLISLGALVYGMMFFSLLALDATWIPVALSIGGIASAAIYGPSLSLLSRAVPTEARASAMGLMNAAGTFGMFVGNLLAGAIAAIALSSGFDRSVAYGAVFAVAGASQFAGALVSRSFRSV